MDRTLLSCVRLRENAIPEIFLGYPCHQRIAKETQSLRNNLESSDDDEPPVKTMFFRSNFISVVQVLLLKLVTRFYVN